MLLKDYFPNLNKKYHRVSFAGIALNSNETKKDIFFLHLKEIILMEIFL